MPSFDSTLLPLWFLQSELLFPSPFLVLLNSEQKRHLGWGLLVYALEIGEDSN